MGDLARRQPFLLTASVRGDPEQIPDSRISLIELKVTHFPSGVQVGSYAAFKGQPGAGTAVQVVAPDVGATITRDPNRQSPAVRGDSRGERVNSARCPHGSCRSLAIDPDEAWCALAAHRRGFLGWKKRTARANPLHDQGG